jgi:hypothetical protein
VFLFNYEVKLFLSIAGAVKRTLEHDQRVQSTLRDDNKSRHTIPFNQVSAAHHGQKRRSRKKICYVCLWSSSVFCPAKRGVVAFVSSSEPRSARLFVVVDVMFNAQNYLPINLHTHALVISIIAGEQAMHTLDLCVAADVLSSEERSDLCQVTGVY